MRSSKPIARANASTKSYGVVVASTILSPAARCLSMSARANGCTSAVSSGTALRTASSTMRRDLPFIAVAPWRASSIEGSVSPTVLNSR